MTKKKKSKKKARVDKSVKIEVPTDDEDYSCDVPEEDGSRCGDIVHLGWGVLGEQYRICTTHWCAHCDDDLAFSLHEAFNIPRLNSAEVDKFGFNVPYDHPDLNKGKMPSMPGQKRGKKKASRDRSKPSPSPYYNKPTKQRIATKRTVKITEEKNDVFDNIFNMEE
ncbi:MAG: hypothetical protein KAS32_10175 [Candidatus Peribacteraceae bacterium]|nr:hypothetical protein [Candidatus Peribacteraceae bacterium]